MHERHELFRHCPRCGAPRETQAAAEQFRCSACGLRLYFNPTLAAVVFVQREDGHALFIRRAREPGLGRLAPPGGFVDRGERAEDAARREVREEVGLALTDLQFLVSEPNEYPYDGVLYPVVDLYFTARATNPTQAAALDDVAGIEWLDPLTTDPELLAFPSMQRALRFWQAHARR